jgi:hypothetical protein
MRHRAGSVAPFTGRSDALAPFRYYHVLSGIQMGNRGLDELGWNGAASTYFWVAPMSELVVIILQQVEPYDFTLPLLLQAAIYAAIEK